MAEPVVYTEEQIQKASYPDITDKNLAVSKIPLKRFNATKGRVYFQGDVDPKDRIYVYSSTTIIDNVLAKGIGFDMWLGNATSYKDAMDYGRERANIGSCVHALCMYLVWGETIDTRDGFILED